MLIFAGDINLTDWDFNFGFGIGSRIAKGFNPFSGIERRDSDLWIGNFEGVASDITDKKRMAAEVFRVNPDTLQYLPHFDIYGLANNHAMQHGTLAYEQTVKALKKYGCIVFGSKDSRSYIIKHQGKKVSLTGCSLRIDEFTDDPSYWYNPEYCEIIDTVTSLPADAFKVLYVHWGNEYINYPSSQQKKFAHWLIDVGFDLVIGMHPHVLQGYEEYKGKRIYYSLGNFVFDMVWEPCRYGAIVGVDLSNDRPIFQNEYVYIDKICVPRIVREDDVPEPYRFEYLNSRLQKESNTEQYHYEINKLYRAYSRTNRKNVIKNIFRYPCFGINVISDFVRRRFLK